ncbi:hypothetical protein F4780DRAFT_689205 [Xylariomycetidae sp. FL0641]|nr:hypothetical protein F4780DRAFT_689205 [Xylariomycetidae sp. FL0641]
MGKYSGVSRKKKRTNRPIAHSADDSCKDDHSGVVVTCRCLRDEELDHFYTVSTRMTRHCGVVCSAPCAVSNERFRDLPSAGPAVSGPGASSSFFLTSAPSGLLAPELALSVTSSLGAASSCVCVSSVTSGSTSTSSSSSSPTFPSLPTPPVPSPSPPAPSRPSRGSSDTGTPGRRRHYSDSDSPSPPAPARAGR